MDRCFSKVKTSTGTYTFHNEKVHKCKAKQNCYAKGETLAPLTKHAERLKVLEGVKVDDAECKEYLNGELFHHGVDFEVCEGKPVGYSSTGEQITDIDEYFTLINTGETYKHLDAQFYPVSPFEDAGWSMLANGRSYVANYEARYICMKPAAEAEAIVGQSKIPASFVVLGCLVCAFFVSAVGLAVAYFKGKRSDNKGDCDQLEEC